MDIKVCDRCGQVYLYNKNTLFDENGVSGFNVIKRHVFGDEEPGRIIHYDLCDSCCILLFDFLETDETYAVNGRQVEDIRKGKLSW